jgi:hypothetical protein
MCSCDYFLLLNYRCAAVEKDEFSWSVPLLDLRIAFGNYALTGTDVKTTASILGREVLPTEAMSAFPREENFYFSPLR